LKPLIWLQRAADQLEAELEYVAAGAPLLLERVRTAEHALQRFPGAGRPLGRFGARKFVVPATDLVLIYQDKLGEVRILACFHGRQNWQRRFQR
jgi:plasmid stabilization system protein ParE